MKTKGLMVMALLFSGAVFAQETTVKTSGSAAVNANTSASAGPAAAGVAASSSVKTDQRTSGNVAGINNSTVKLSQEGQTGVNGTLKTDDIPSLEKEAGTVKQSVAEEVKTGVGTSASAINSAGSTLQSSASDLQHEVGAAVQPITGQVKAAASIASEVKANAVTPVAPVAPVAATVSSSIKTAASQSMKIKSAPVKVNTRIAGSAALGIL